MPAKKSSPTKPARKPATKSSTATKSKEPFLIEAPGASSVLLAGSFTAWQEKPIKLKPLQNGTWKATVSLEPGIYEYRFVVDGSWRDDPRAANHVTNAFGTRNAVRQVAV